ncbi:hypothetical protein GWR56_12835 [Mucilaginibacter sp. 14171R-50]|uniref:DinB family protein n=1 Tax=Mucilaginibacter sp. 14171R-50 TaxID=2703789 RepID=UPI00138B4277|nr:DinB family protein [Mucilaginibacter sp. 14171R-50]QHS56379.1 hypothetical protein GWR56_12835 [Mucilaginibacter sp. 14171R-50]
MYVTLLRQYQLVISARGALFDYCETIKPAHLLTPLPSFNNESMVSQLMHVANCYLFWLANSVLQQQRPYFGEEEHRDLRAVRNAYQQVDLITNDFLHAFKDSPEQQMFITRPDGNTLTRSPFEVFTHVITHEFHHKGQVINMSRQLGYTPVDTDIIRE